MDPTLPTTNQPVQTQQRSSGPKEQSAGSSMAIESVSHPDEHIPKEIAQNGIEVRREQVDIPPDVAQLGVQVSGGGQKPGQLGTVNVSITLPISDDQVISGLHENFKSSIRWLAIWCLKQLKRAHLALKVVHGKVMRVKA